MKSVLDYLILSISLMKNIEKFKVLPPNFDFKNAPISATLRSYFVVKVGKWKVLNHPKKYKWNNQSAVLSHSLLSKVDTQEKLGKLRFDSSSNTNAIQKAVKYSLIVYRSMAIKLLKLKRKERWIRNQKDLVIVRTVLFLENNLSKLLNFS